MTVAQAVVEYLSKQYTVDSINGVDFRERLIPGTFGISGTAMLPVWARR